MPKVLFNGPTKTGFKWECYIKAGRKKFLGIGETQFEAWTRAFHVYNTVLKGEQVG